MSKGPNAFRTISEAADEIGVPQHVLRFWETRFSFVRPMKRAGGRRFYRPQDIAVLKGVRELLYTRGFKIEGVQRLYREKGAKHLAEAAGSVDGVDFEPEALPTLAQAEAPAGMPIGLDAAGRRRLQVALEAVEAARSRLSAVLQR